jgi:hypothetical protein
MANMPFALLKVAHDGRRPVTGYSYHFRSVSIKYGSSIGDMTGPGENEQPSETFGTDYHAQLGNIQIFLFFVLFPHLIDRSIPYTSKASTCKNFGIQGVMV